MSGAIYQIFCRRPSDFATLTIERTDEVSAKLAAHEKYHAGWDVRVTRVTFEHVAEWKHADAQKEGEHG